ncbi:MAG TPA: phosphoserine phosphatase SerB [Dongiaceae bacterium]|nr:phosphoserine phosphatase SerB [Dongiaceae bacterium]
MECILTLIAGDSAKLTPALIETLTARLREAGARAGEPYWLAPGDRACDLPFDRLEPGRVHEIARATLADLPVDFHAQPEAGRRKKLLIADMDSTVVTTETLDELAAEAGLKDVIAEITRRSMRGELDFSQALIERVAMLADLPESALARTAAATRLTPGARTLVQTMKADGAFTALVSGGFKYFTSRVAALVGFDLDLANDLEISEGRLTGELAGPILDKDGKVNALRTLAAERGLAVEDAVTVGDGANDLPMLLAAGLGVAFHGKPLLREQVRAQVNHNDLSALLYFQGYRQEEHVP